MLVPPMNAGHSRSDPANGVAINGPAANLGSRHVILWARGRAGSGLRRGIPGAAGRSQRDGPGGVPVAVPLPPTILRGVPRDAARIRPSPAPGDRAGPAREERASGDGGLPPLGLREPRLVQRLVP